MKAGPSGESAYQIVMKLLKKALKTKLIQGGRDEVGVLFYNTVSSAVRIVLFGNSQFLI